MDKTHLKKYAPVLVRAAMAMVFLWFSINQFIDPEMFTDYIPKEAGSLLGFIPNTLVTLVYLNAVFELILGTMLLVGYFTRISSMLLSLHLFVISFGLGYGATMIRDFGLAFATFSVFLNGPDTYCLDSKKKSV